MTDTMSQQDRIDELQQKLAKSDRENQLLRAMVGHSIRLNAMANGMKDEGAIDAFINNTLKSLCNAEYKIIDGYGIWLR